MRVEAADLSQERFIVASRLRAGGLVASQLLHHIVPGPGRPPAVTQAPLSVTFPFYTPCYNPLYLCVR